MFVFGSIFFLVYFLFFSFPFRFFPNNALLIKYSGVPGILLFWVYACTTCGCVPGIVRLQVRRDGIPQLVSTVPSRTGTAVHVLFCFLPSRRFG